MEGRIILSYGLIWARQHLDWASNICIALLLLVTYRLHNVTVFNASIVGVGLLYAWLMKWRGEEPTALERQFTISLRKRIPVLNGRTLDEMDDSAWFSNPSITQSILTLVNGVNLIQTVLQGRYATAELLAAFTILVAACFNIAKTPKDKKMVLRLFLRASVGMQAVHLVHRDAAHTHIRRFLVMRILSNMIMFDSVIDGAFQLLFLASLVAWKNDDHTALVIASMAVALIIVPLSVFPVRGLIAKPMVKRLDILFPNYNPDPGAKKWSKDFPIHFWIHMVITVFPLLFIVSSSAGGSINSNLSRNLNLTMGLAFLARAAQLVPRRMEERRKRMLARRRQNSEDEQLPHYDTSSSSLESGRLDAHAVSNHYQQRFVFSMCWLLTVANLVAQFASTSWKSSPVICLVVLVCGLLLIPMHMRNDFIELIWIHGVLCMVFARERPWMVIGLAASRLPLVLATSLDPFDCIPCLLVASSSIFLLAWFDHRYELNYLIVTYLACLFGMLQKYWAHYLAQRVVVSELDSDSFLQHALKQKLAAIVNAVNGAVMLSNSPSVSPHAPYPTIAMVSARAIMVGSGSGLTKPQQTIWEEDEEGAFEADHNGCIKSSDVATAAEIVQGGDFLKDEEYEDMTDGDEEKEIDVAAEEHLSQVFKQVMFEARLRHHDCHFLNIVRSLRIGRELIWKSEVRQLDEVLTQFSNELFLCIVPSSNQCTLDEDLLSASAQSMPKSLNSPSASSCSTISSRWHPVRSSTCSDVSTASGDSLAVHLRMRWELVELAVSRIKGLSGMSKSNNREEIQYEVVASPNDNDPSMVGKVALNLVLMLERPSAALEVASAACMLSNVAYLMSVLNLGQLEIVPNPDASATIKITFFTETWVSAEDELEASVRNGGAHISQAAAQPSSTVIAPLVTSKMRRRSKVVSRRDSDVVPLPSHLVFAILDDVTLVRRILLNLLMKYCDASPNSFIQGDTADEAYAFCEVVMSRKVDFVIIDQNLSFLGGEEVFGLDIARKLREMGYQGCIVLYSADNEGLFDHETAIDGFLEKGVHRNGSLRPALAAAWAKRMKRS